MNNNDAKTNADKIEVLISQINDLVDQLEDAATQKANSKANYSQAIGLMLLKLKNGIITKFEDQDVKNLTAGERQVVAEAMCYNEEFEKDASENLYKALIVKIEARKAQMNGYQSINKVIE
jgi:hypothetical protein